MRHSVLYGVAMAPSVCLFLAACYLAANDISGWGWFLLVGVFCLPTVKTTDDEKSGTSAVLR